ncbi:MAG TPA: hypothetical protein VI072_03545 [Polyangiaceae bacterium]
MMPSFFMTGTGSSQFTRISLLLLTLTRLAVAEPVSMPEGDPAAARSQDDLNLAAQLFDQGVQQFSRQEYENSARSFLAADALLPNTKALMNAIAAARQAPHPVLTARAAQRALQREGIDQGVAKMARDALAGALPYVATLQLQCEPEPCSLKINGEPIAAGTHYVSAGAHEIRAAGPDGRAQESLTAAAGSEYRLLLPLGQPAVAQTPPARANPATRGEDTARTSDTDVHASKKPFSPVVFGLGCTGTLALVALTTWSGLEVLSARNLHDTDPVAYDPEEVKERQRRTDLLVAGSVVLGAATAAAGIWLVDWGSSTRAAVHVLPQGGLTLAARRDF